MEKSYFVARIYGYLVCLVSIVVALIAVNSIITAAFAIKDPLHTQDYRIMGPETRELSSFEAYKLSCGQCAPKGFEDKTTAPQVNDNELKTAYEAAKADRARSVTFNAYRTLTTNAILLVLGVLLFRFHWTWLAKKETV